SRTGAHIIVNALAEVLNDYSGNLLCVNNDNTMVYNYKSTDTAPTPDMARLPAGTLDYIVNTVTYGGMDFYLTNSGKRIRTNAVSIQENRALGTNPISVTSVYKDGTDTILKLKTTSKIPFSISYNDQTYSDGDNGYYYISSFSATGITITFDYITSISAGDITFPDSAVFSTGTWSTSKSGDMTKTMLTLKFRQAGIYSGVTATYDSEDNLTFRFNGCRSSISGATIVIDPGHGYTGKSTFDPGAVGHIKEQDANLAIAKYLAAYLEEEGANVIRLKTESETYETETRAVVARQYDPDMFISVHCNSAGESATGAEAYYFTPFSQPLAKYISAEMGAYLHDNVDFGGNGDRGAKYNYFWVTQQQDFPSILIESGFVSNYTEAMALANPTHQKNLAKAIVRGIEKYFAACGYSCFGEGYGTVGGVTASSTGGTEITAPQETPAETEPPAETAPPVSETYPWETGEVTSALPPNIDPSDPYYQYFFGNSS
ncbi:MAG: N-acetylmuramoyl-L-alanine amidase, partial [Oscillospiraceae bacterium]